MIKNKGVDIVHAYLTKFTLNEVILDNYKCVLLSVSEKSISVIRPKSFGTKRIFL